MLSSFFSKSKPINFIVVGLYMLFLFILAHYKQGFVLESPYAITFFGGLIVYILSMLLLNFIVQKNDLTQKSTHCILLFAFLSSVLPTSLIRFELLLANLLVLLALLGVLNLRDESKRKSRIFNASLYIGIASLIYFWSIGFILLVFLGVLFFEPKNYRNWIIPIIGLITVYLFANWFTLVFEDSFFPITEFVGPVSLSFDSYLIDQNLFSLGIVLICTVFFFSVYLIKFKKHSAKVKPALNLVTAHLLIAIIIVSITSQKDTSELYFVCGPLAIIGTTYLELGYSKWVKEINILVFLLLPFMKLLL